VAERHWKTDTDTAVVVHAADSPARPRSLKLQIDLGEVDSAPLRPAPTGEEGDEEMPGFKWALADRDGEIFDVS
jgi:hypothetical protein